MDNRGVHWGPGLAPLVPRAFMGLVDAQLEYGQHRAPSAEMGSSSMLPWSLGLPVDDRLFGGAATQTCWALL